MVHRILIGILISALAAFTAKGSQQEIPELTRKLQNTGIDSLRVMILNQLSLAYCDTNTDRSVFYARQALNLANQINFQEGIARSNINFGYIFTKNRSFQPAINYYLIGIKIYDKLNNDSIVSNVYNKIARIFELQGKNNQALDYYNKSLQYAEKSCIFYEKAYALNYIGGIHFDEANFNQAYEYFMEGLLLREQVGDSIGLAASYNNIGEIFRIRNDFENALDYYFRSMELNKFLNNPEWLAINYGNIGAVYMEQALFEMAYNAYINALEINTSLGNDEGIASSLNNLGNYYLSRNDFNNAMELFLQAFQIAKNNNLLPQKSDAALGLSSAYADLSNLDIALDYYKIHAQTKDSIFNLEKTIQIAELEARHNADRAEQQLLLKDQEFRMFERNKYINSLRYTIIIGGLILFIVIAALMYGRQRNMRRKDRELMKKNRQIMEANKRLMESELKTKDNELINFALHIVQKNDFLKSVKNDLKDVKNKCEEEKVAKINELFMKLNQNLRMNTELEKFQKNVDQVNHEFFEKLQTKFPNLTDNEKRLSALLRINLSSKEIATLNNISIKAVEMGRYRLRKKLNLETNDVLARYLHDL